MASWEDDDFEPPEVAAQEVEEAFVHSSAPSDGAGGMWLDGDGDFPVLIVDLAPLVDEARRTCEEARDVSAAAVRDTVRTGLLADWTTRSGELLLAGQAWHVPRRDVATRREAHEAARPEAILTSFEYPSELEGVRTTSLWRAVTRPTPWECCDAVKAHVAVAHRPLKWMAEMALEVEELAEAEADASEGLSHLERKLNALRLGRRDALARMHAEYHAAASGSIELEAGAARDGDTGIDPAAAAAMVDSLKEIDERIAQVQGTRDAAKAEVFEGGAEEGVPSLLHVCLDVIFARGDHHRLGGLDGEWPSPNGQAASWAEQATTAVQRKRELLRMWQSTFGRLPAASPLVLKHAPRAPPPRAPNGRPRMLVPAPPCIKPSERP